MQNKTKPQPNLTQETINRFWSKVEKRGPDDCWVWKAWKNNRGYGMLTIKKAGSKHHWVASRLSYYIAHGNLPNDLDVCHKCDNPPCVNPNHLFLGTAHENALDMVKKGRCNAPKGEDAQSTLSEYEVLQIRRIYESGDMNTVELAEAYGVASGTINRVVDGSSWKHITHGVSLIKSRRGERNGFAKLREPDIREIRRMRSDGITMQCIADRFRIGRTTVGHIVYGRYWKHVI